jgi:hypothetical protein
MVAQYKPDKNDAGILRSITYVVLLGRSDE